MDFFVAKVDSQGKFLWVRSGGGTKIDRGYAVATDKDGNCYVTGHYQSTDAKFDTIAQSNNGDYDSFVQGTVAYQSSTTYSLEGPANKAVGDTPAYTTWDFSVGTAKKNWTLEAFIQNATDARGEIARISECSDPLKYCWAHHKVLPIKPMYYGIKFGQRF